MVFQINCGGAAPLPLPSRTLWVKVDVPEGGARPRKLWNSYEVVGIRFESFHLQLTLYFCKKQ